MVVYSVREYTHVLEGERERERISQNNIEEYIVVGQEI